MTNPIRLAQRANPIRSRASIDGRNMLLAVANDVSRTRIYIYSFSSLPHSLNHRYTVDDDVVFLQHRTMSRLNLAPNFVSCTGKKNVAFRLFFVVDSNRLVNRARNLPSKGKTDGNSSLNVANERAVLA